MTGTLIGGKAGHVRSLLFRMSPKSLKAEDLAWENDMEFARRYGRVDTIITEKTSAADDNRRSNGKSTTKRQAEQPGIMPTLYGRHLIGNTIFLSLKDVAENLPAYDEHPIAVRMGADLVEAYRDVEGKLKDAVAEMLRRGNHQLLSGDAACPAWRIPTILSIGSPSATSRRRRPQRAVRACGYAAHAGPQHALAQGEEAAGDPGAGKVRGSPVLGVLRLYEHAPGARGGWRKSSRMLASRLRYWRPTRFPPGTAANGLPRTPLAWT